MIKVEKIIDIVIALINLATAITLYNTYKKTSPKKKKPKRKK